MPNVIAGSTVTITDPKNNQDIPTWGRELSTNGGGYVADGEYKPTAVAADGSEGSTDTYTFEDEYLIPVDADPGDTYQLRYSPGGLNTGKYAAAIFESSLYTVVLAGTGTVQTNSLSLAISM